MHVLIATDGSSVSSEAARRGTTLLGRPETITLMTVVSEIPGDDAGGFEGSVYSPEEQEVEWNAEMKEASEELARTAQALTGAEIMKRVEVGDVPSTICRIAETRRKPAVRPSRRSVGDCATTAIAMMRASTA